MTSDECANSSGG